MRKLPLGLLLLFCLVALAGCRSGTPRASVSGTVKYRNTPLPTGTVTFISEDGKVVESGVIRDGQYTIAKAPVGPVKIAVSTPPPLPPMQGKQKVPDKSKEATDAPSVAIPAHYASADTSKLTHTVTSEATQTHNIDLQ